MQGFITISLFILLGFIFFCIYFIFKQMQFVIQAINLYKDMVTRQDVTIKLLKDIRSINAGEKVSFNRDVYNHSENYSPSNKKRKDTYVKVNGKNINVFTVDEIKTVCNRDAEDLMKKFEIVQDGSKYLFMDTPFKNIDDCLSCAIYIKDKKVYEDLMARFDILGV